MYPENVAYPFGGEESNEFVLIELHYDNPHEIAGIMYTPCVVAHMTHQTQCMQLSCTENIITLL